MAREIPSFPSPAKFTLKHHVQRDTDRYMYTGINCERERRCIYRGVANNNNNINIIILLVNCFFVGGGR